MKKIICVIAVIGLTIAAAAPAQAARHEINSTIKLAAIATTESPPLSGSADYVGTFEGALGSGAIVGLNFFGPIPTFHGSFRIYLRRGTLRGHLEGIGAPTSGGGLDLSGSGEFTRGSGKYEGAHGEFTFSGGRPSADPHVDTLAVSGSVRY